MFTVEDSLILGVWEILTCCEINTMSKATTVKYNAGLLLINM
jgi:hypothetical protein